MTTPKTKKTSEKEDSHLIESLTLISNLQISPSTLEKIMEKFGDAQLGFLTEDCMS